MLFPDRKKFRVLILSGIAGDCEDTTGPTTCGPGIFVYAMLAIGTIPACIIDTSDLHLPDNVSPVYETKSFDITVI